MPEVIQLLKFRLRCSVWSVCALTALMLLINVVPGLAQDVSFKIYNDQNGLPSAEVYKVFEDHDGFIWFATDNGVVRFDGGEMKLFNLSNGLADPVVFSILEDSKNGLWFRTFSGATSVYRNEKMTPYPFNTRLKSIIKKGCDYSIVPDSTGVLHIGTCGIGTMSVTQQGDVEQVPGEPGVIYLRHIENNNYILSGLSLHARPIFFSHNGKKHRLDLTGEETIFFCHQFWKNRLYFSTGTRIFQYDGSVLKQVLLTKKKIISLSTDKEDNLWIGFLNGGATRFSDASLQRPLEMTSLQSHSVSSVLQDREGSLWFSTLDRGVFCLVNPYIRNFSLMKDLKIADVLPGHENTVVAFDNGTIICIDHKTRVKKWLIDVHEPVISGLFDSVQNCIWISTTRHTFLIDPSGKILRKIGYAFGARNFIGAKKIIRHGNKIWGINVHGVYVLDPNGNLLRAKEIDFRCRNIAVDQNRIYLAGITGLYQSDTSLSTLVKIGAFENDKVSGILPLGSEKFLVATIGNGFKIVEDKKVIAYGVSQQRLPFENIYSVSVDSAIWMATEKGLLRVDRERLVTQGFFTYDFLDKSTGLMSDKINFVARNGNETWCFINDGFSVFEDGKINFANKNPLPRLNKVTINNNPVSLSRLGDLTHLENNICFDFGFLSFTNRNIYIRHKSDQNEKQWNYTRDFLISYFSLSPGRHEIDIQYSTDRMHWESILMQHIYIRPPWWETVYFKLAVLVLIGLIFFSYFRSRYKGRLLELEAQNKLRLEKERIARDLHDNIGSKLVSLSLGLNDVVKKYDIPPRLADSIYNNVNTTVTELRDTIWAIQKEGITFSQFFDKLRNLVWRLRQNGETIRYELNIDVADESTILMPIQALNLYRIVQEAIANSQKHSGCDTLSISIFHGGPGKLFCCKVRDNGSGFIAEMDSKGEKHGLQNMHARAAEIMAALEVSSKIDAGTQVTISLSL